MIFRHISSIQDLNGKKVYCKSASTVNLIGISVENNAHLTLEDNSPSETGTFELKVNNVEAYSLIANPYNGCLITINGGNHSPWMFNAIGLRYIRSPFVLFVE